MLNSVRARTREAEGTTFGRRLGVEAEEEEEEEEQEYPPSLSASEKQQKTEEEQEEKEGDTGPDYG